MSEGQENPNVQEEQPVATEDANVDYKTLYLDEVQNAKKLRKRAQDSESTIQDFTKAQETQKVKQLRKQEKFEELSQSLQAQLDEVSPYKERWESHEASEREGLLSKLPEEDREGLQGESTQALKYIVQKLEDRKPVNPQASPGVSRKNLSEKSISSMTEKEKADNWQNILKAYKK
tara:strand:- start:3166 stop:3693 length:528 start_codon:yes stop_codon:yes gene_type:complete